MIFKIESQMQFPMATISMQHGEGCRISSGSMVYHSDGVTLQAHLNGKGGGIGKFVGALARSAVSGESVFITEVSCNAASGDVAIAPSIPGSITSLDVGTRQYCLNDYTFLAMESTVNYSMKRQNIGKAIFSRSGGLFVMHTEGQGKMLINSFGSIKEIMLDNVRNFAVDNGHVVAWDSTLNYEIKLQSGFFGSIGTGEGLINVFNGTGRLLIQSLNLDAFGGVLTPYLKISR
ncbi:MAG: TIGR00266 family protein [Lachnospiraceae bacterium]|jgi:uncharacterized protein (TIGR00266 family)|nr:TIGR00266 family protein [Lachnospiraceae bacterium]